MKASEARKKSQAKKQEKERAEQAKRNKLTAREAADAKNDYKRVLKRFRDEIAKEVKRGGDSAHIYLPEVGNSWRYGEHANVYFCKLRDMLKEQLVVKDGYQLEMTLNDDTKRDTLYAEKYSARFIVRWDEQ